jgi:hypothetical protein
MKKCLLFYIMLNISFSVTQAQNYHDFTFNYDSNGNRVSRSLTLIHKKIDPNQNNQPFVDSTTSDNLSVNVYPNPTQGKLQIEVLNLQPDSKIFISIYDTRNKLAVYKEINIKNTELDLSAFCSGLYYLKISSGKLSFKKVIMKE